MVHFVGAGSGAPDLITLRGDALLRRADVVIWAGSLVNPRLLEVCRDDCEIFDSATMTLEEVLDRMRAAEERGLEVVRLHTGDPCMYGAIQEQMDALDKMDIAYDVVPGVSSFCGAAAALRTELTAPGISQTVTLTRLAGRTPMPEGEDMAALASRGGTMVIFLSAGHLDRLQEELLAAGRDADEPAAIVYKATWADEKVMRCTVGTLAQTGADNAVRSTALVVVGRVLAGDVPRSCLYDPSFRDGFSSRSPGQGLTVAFERYIWSGNRRLRLGYTTGTCAAAAAGAAARALLFGEPPASVTVRVPAGEGIEVEVVETRRDASGVTCAVRKDGGDDIDATDGALIRARVELTGAEGIEIDGGAGVGRVTKPGLDQPVGAAAINSVPRRMIAEAVEDALAEAHQDRGAKVTIIVPMGEEIAAKTFNPNLGIVGGISIWGPRDRSSPVACRRCATASSSRFARPPPWARATWSWSRGTTGRTTCPAICGSAPCPLSPAPTSWVPPSIARRARGLSACWWWGISGRWSRCAAASWIPIRAWRTPAWRSWRPTRRRPAPPRNGFGRSWMPLPPTPALRSCSARAWSRRRANRFPGRSPFDWAAARARRCP